MITAGMAHQIEALRVSEGRDYFAFLMEQGTGKTWVTLADAERLYEAGEIDGMLVCAPRGVHANWVIREIPAHMDTSKILMRVCRSGAGKKKMAQIEQVLMEWDRGGRDPLRVLAINIDAMMTKGGRLLAARLLRSRRCVFVLDESSRIKNPQAVRTKVLMEMRPMMKYVRILSGTPVNNNPADIFSQYEFMRPGLLGTTSYRAFVAEYTELMPLTHPMLAEMIKRNPKAAYAQLPMTNPDGSPRYKNLDKLRPLILAHGFRILKRQCLDLPDKVYTQLYFELTPKQQAAYDLMKKELRVEIPAVDENSVPELFSFAALSAISKLQQITSGFVMMRDGTTHYIEADENPRIKALLDYVEDVSGPFIVWARFTEEIQQIAAALRKQGLRVVEYHGSVKDAARDEAVDAIQQGRADAFVGQAQAGGIGLTLTKAELAIYFSSDFNSETRKQSEDRNHRIGTVNKVVYVDMIAEDTIDEGIARSLARKKTMAANVLGDDLVPESGENRPTKKGT